MPVETRKISVVGKEDCGIVDITGIVSEEVKNSKISNGTVTVFCVGSTEAKQCLFEGVDILAPGCGIAPRTPLANIRALVEARDEWYSEKN